MSAELEIAVSNEFTGVLTFADDIARMAPPNGLVRVASPLSRLARPPRRIPRKLKHSLARSQKSYALARVLQGEGDRAGAEREVRGAIGRLAAINRPAFSWRATCQRLPDANRCSNPLKAAFPNSTRSRR